MKKILIINTKNNKDLLSHSLLLSQFAEQYELSLLNISKHTNADLLFNCFSHTETINVDELSSIFESKLFSNVLLLEKIYSQLSYYKKTKWDLIINFSSDKLSALLGSYLKNNSQDYFGYYWNLGQVFSSSHLLDELTLEINHDLHINADDLIARKLNLSSSCEIVKIYPSIVNKVKKYIEVTEEIKDLDNFKTVGFVLHEKAKWINQENAQDVIDFINTHQSIIPVFVTSNRQQTDLLQNLAKPPVVIESNQQSLASIASALDLIVTADVAIANYLSHVQKKCLFINSNKFESLKLLQLGQESNVLQPHGELNLIDLNSSILYALSQSRLVKPILISSTLLSVFYDHLGQGLNVVNTSENPMIYLINLINRDIYKKVCLRQNEDQKVIDFSKIELNAISKYIAEQKEMLSLIQKEALGAIRNVSLSSENKAHAKAFVNNITNLLELAEIKTSAQSLLKKFKSDMLKVSMDTGNTSLLLKETIYDLKEELQKVVNLLSAYEVEILDQKKLQLNKKAQHSILTSGDGYEFISGRNESRA